jgi:hypothetical protein
MTSEKFTKSLEDKSFLKQMEISFTRIHEHIAQFNVLFTITIHKISSHALELFFQQRVSEAEGRGSKFGKDGGITGGIISC